MNGEKMVWLKRFCRCGAALGGPEGVRVPESEVDWVLKTWYKEHSGLAHGECQEWVQKQRLAAIKKSQSVPRHDRYRAKKKHPGQMDIADMLHEFGCIQTPEQRHEGNAR